MNAVFPFTIKTLDNIRQNCLFQFANFFKGRCLYAFACSGTCFLFCSHQGSYF